MNASKRKIKLQGISLPLASSSSLCLVTLLSILTCVASVSAKSQIVFQNGIYQNITIALEENDPFIEMHCRDIISRIQETFIQASVYLQQATDGRAAFGSIRVLIPEKWNYSSCSTATLKPSFFESYETADIRVTHTHPIAASLPWTDQPGLCGKPGNNIYLPSKFLWNANFTTEVRAAMLLHAWMKFRYGVFEEYGFFGDPYFPACYSKGSEMYYTACMSPTPQPLETVSQNPRTCKQLVEENHLRLETQIKEAASRSIMFAPQVTPTQNLVCKQQSHNRLAITKQNYLCDRKSVETVMLQHADFNQSSAPRRMEQINAVSIQPVKLSKRASAYAIVVDNSKGLTQMQIEALLLSLQEFIHFIREADETMLYYMPIDQDLDQFPPKKITEQAHKGEFYELISNSLEVRPGDNDKPKVDSNVYQIVQNKLKEEGPEKKWHVLHIATPPPNAARVLPALMACDFKLKLVTFETGYGEWLQWNSVTQTEFVLVLPTCTPGDVVCLGKTSLVLTTKLLEDLQNEDPARHFQLIFDGKTSAGRVISMPDVGVPVKDFLMTMYTPDKNKPLNVTSPGRKCSVRNLTNNSKSHQFTTDCFYEPGNWTFANPQNSSELGVRAFAELSGNEMRALSQVGLNLAEPVDPNSHRMSIPLHIGVRSNLDQPILTAAVEAEVSFMGSAGLETRTFQLKDDGVYPDSTKDDGIYSGYFAGWSEKPSYHFGLVRITSNNNTRILTEISTETTSAALLDTNMESKCCGSAVPLKLTIQDPSFATLVVPLPSILTSKTLNNPSLLPPGEITFLEKTSESAVQVELSVVSPETGNEDSAIAYFLACSTECNGCAILDSEECKPRGPGENGPCTVNKAKLQDSVSGWNCPTASSGSLQFALAGVNSADVRGRLSRQVFDVTLTREAIGDEPTCKSLKDKCLPIWLFWTLVGVSGGLLILVIIVLICVCCLCRNRKKNVSEGKAEFISKPHSAEKLTNGGFKAPTSTNETVKKYDYSASSNNEEFNSSAYFTQRPEARRAPPGEENLGYTSFSTSTAKQISRYAEENRSNMQPQYTHHSRSQQDLGTQIYSSANSRSLPRKSSVYDEDGRMTMKSAKSQKEVVPPPHENQYGRKIRTVSSFVDDDPSDTNTREPAYATVSRKHRRNNQNPAYRYSQPPLMAHQTTRPIQFLASKDNTRPRSTIGVNFGHSRAPADKYSSRPVRLDHFPSSESETYSEMSRLESLPPGPPPPPPLPSASNSAKFKANRQIPKREPVVHNDDDTQSDTSGPSEAPNQAAPATGQPNGFGILAQMGSLPDRKSLLKPKQGPPPPPPRSSGRKFDPSFLHTANIHDAEDSPARGRQASRINDVDENDSDTWDIDDDFQYDPDVSHV